MTEAEQQQRRRAAGRWAIAFALIMALALEPASVLLGRAVPAVADSLSPTCPDWPAGALWALLALGFGALGGWLFGRLLAVRDNGDSNDGWVRFVWQGWKLAYAFPAIAALFLAVEAVLGVATLISASLGWDGLDTVWQQGLLTIVLIAGLLLAWLLACRALDRDQQAPEPGGTVSGEHEERRR